MNKLLCLALVLLAAAAVAQEPKPPADARARRQHVGAVVRSGDAARRDATPQRRRAGHRSRSGTPAAANKPAAKPAPRGNAKDRLDLDSTQITGNRELPKVLYIVPWRSAELGDLVGRPVNSLLDEVLEPVDRDVFRRQNRYFEALQPNARRRPPPASAEK